LISFFFKTKETKLDKKKKSKRNKRNDLDLDSCRGQIRSVHTKSKTIERRRLETLTQRNTKEKEGAKWEILREKEGG
jgi:hypothetical protein